MKILSGWIKHLGVLLMPKNVAHHNGLDNESCWMIVLQEWPMGFWSLGMVDISLAGIIQQ